MTLGRKAFYLVLGIVLIVATTVRIMPLITGGERLRGQYVIDDGYYMLTMARNLALGRGISVSDGLIATNGTQPLGTFVYALGFVLTQGDKLQGLYVAHAVQIVFAVLTAVLLFFGFRNYFYRGPESGDAYVPFLVAGVWFASPTSIMHTQNGLETGLAALAILICLVAYDAWAPRLRTGLRPEVCLGLGLLLGVAFWARNDSCFLVAAMLVVHAVSSYRQGRTGTGVVQGLIMGATSVATAVPWLWFNWTRFGHPVPVSGRAESLNVPFGYNFLASMSTFLEDISLVGRIPEALERNPRVQAVCGLVLLAVLIIAWRQRRWLASHFSAGVGVLGCFVLFLYIHYALFFEMPTFLGRYFFPAVMLAAIVGVPAAAAVFQGLWARPWMGRSVAVLAAVAAVALCLGLDLRLVSQRGNLQLQLVNWVAANVPEGTWVGAVQTGTLGYYYDRTINLDGKVDPQAFAHRQANRLPDYLLKRKVEYLVDWVGICDWAQRPEFAKYYQILLVDPEQNLGVMKRKTGSLVATH